LYNQSRYADAERELRGALAGEPDAPSEHALLSLCLVEQDRLDEAQAEAEQAIALSPDDAFAHYCRSHILRKRRRFTDAEASAREALRLAPDDPDYWAQLADTLQAQGRWKDALDAALQGLSHDAEHAACETCRALALTKLGKTAAAMDSVDAVLARNPENALAHANKGWALLHQQKPRPALESFREALRIDPTMEYAQAGIVEALKARNLLYRWMLAYFLRMSRLGNRAQWAVILVGYFGARSLRNLSRERPELEPWIAPILVLYVVFVLLTWFSVPLFNLMLRCNRFGAYALSRDQRASSNWFGLCLACFVIATTLYLFSGEVTALVAAAVSVGSALPLISIYSCDAGWPRRTMVGYAAAMSGLGLLAIAAAYARVETTSSLLMLLTLGFFATPWLANYLTRVTVVR
jgi:Tfp pilus assembly protein PilF